MRVESTVLGTRRLIVSRNLIPGSGGFKVGSPDSCGISSVNDANKLIPSIRIAHLPWLDVQPFADLEQGGIPASKFIGELRCRDHFLRRCSRQSTRPHG